SGAGRGGEVDGRAAGGHARRVEGHHNRSAGGERVGVFGVGQPVAVGVAGLGIGAEQVLAQVVEAVAVEVVAGVVELGVGAVLVFPAVGQAVAVGVAVPGVEVRWGAAAAEGAQIA